METREITCIQCPMGCALTVTIDKDRVEVTGNTCPRGAAYGEKEVTHPTRTVTSSVKIEGGDVARLSVKTSDDVPKEKIFDIMGEIHKVTVCAPVALGDVIIHNVAGTGRDIIATKSVAAI